MTAPTATPTATPNDAGAALLQEVLATLRERHGFRKSRVDSYFGPGEIEVRHHFAGGVFTLTSRVVEGRKTATHPNGKPKTNTVTWDGRNLLPTVQDVIYNLFA